MDGVVTHSDSTMMFLRLSLSSALFLTAVSAWMPPAHHRQATRLFSSLPNNYEDIGTELIREAGASCGATSLDITWSAETVTVVVKEGSVFLSSVVDEDSEDGVEVDGDDDADMGVDLPELLSEPAPSNSIDVVQLARAINAAFGEDEVGLRIAETHEIEVTTPGAPDELMQLLDTPVWESYKGFDVITQFMDKKTKKAKTIEGRLQDRNDEFTTINMKGRMKKIKNEALVSIKLPKAKREKGGR